tara:strand:+ start:115 stop:447 length:333 start_codon:yes stop_codon:yes gene_type:complete
MSLNLPFLSEKDIKCCTLYELYSLNLFLQKPQNLLITIKITMKMANCPYCGKVLVENEMYCWHCEQALHDKESYKNKPPKHQNKPSKPLKERIEIFLKPIIDYFKKFKSK